MKEPLKDESLIEWAASWVPDEPPGQKARFVEAMRNELQARQPKPVEFCKNCPFAKHLHWEQGGKLVTDYCSGFELQE